MAKFVRIKDHIINLDEVLWIRDDKDGDLRINYARESETIECDSKEEAKRYLEYILMIGNEK